MNRRDFIKYSSSFVAFSVFPQSILAKEYITKEEQFFPVSFFDKVSKKEEIEKKIEEKKEIIKTVIELKKEENLLPLETTKKVVIKKEKKKPLKVEKHKDVFLEKKYLNELVTVRNKLTLIQRHVGYGNFNILSFDEMLKIAKISNKIEAFSKKELEFLESIFYYDPKYHGFYGSRVSQKITQKISKKEVVKIPRTGHYLFKGVPEKTYHKMIIDVGSSLTLTSGVRSIVKQTKLFLDKIDSVNGNLSIASRSLAPPAYTYHSIADFDVGKKGFGFANFTPRFALTEEFFKMRKLKYIDMRYTINNKDGVRYEPWHVKVI